jgi:cation-transporting ATPase 13A1
MRALQLWARELRHSHRHIQCFLCISRARPIEKLSKERPLSNIFNPYIVLSVLLQFSIHIATMLYMTMLCNQAAP